MPNPTPLGVFGSPVGHILSPALHNAAADALGLDYRYLAYEVHPDDLQEAVRGARAMGFRGLTITIPHKVAVAGLVDELGEDARLMGAVNTIVFEGDGRLVGHNTDGVGWLRSFEEATGSHPRGKRCLVLGAGGAARAVAVKIARCGAAHLEIRNRTPGKALALARFVEKSAPSAKVSGGGLDDPRSAAEGRDIIVNATSLGMWGDAERMAASPLPEDAIPEGCVCSDAVYTPLDTAFLKAARRAGARIVHGTGWLVHQAADAWKLWTGVDMPVDVVMEALLEALESRPGGDA